MNDDARYGNLPLPGSVPLGSAPVPPILELHLSPYCQLSCDYCHAMNSWEGPSGYGMAERILDLGEYKAISDNFAALGGAVVVISGGGEPLLHPTAPEIVSAICESGLETHLYTNGLTSARFKSSSIEQWLGGLRSLRFSIHADAWRSKRETLLRSIEATCLARANQGMDLTVTSAILPDAFDSSSLAQVLALLGRMPIDMIELRHDLSGHPDANIAAIRHALQLAEEAGIVASRLSHRLPAVDGVKVPPRCFVSYRTAVLDPYGGMRLCCMRAHLRRDDVGFIGSVRESSLQDLFATAISRLPEVGPGVCTACSARDLQFSLAFLAR